MIIVIIINIIKSRSVVMKLSSSTQSSMLSSTSWNFFLQRSRIFCYCIIQCPRLLKAAFLFSHSWLYRLHTFLYLHRNFSCSQHLCKNCICFCCSSMNIVWIMNSHTPYIYLFLLWKILLDCYQILLSVIRQKGKSQNGC